VAENLGRLFNQYSAEMATALENSLKSASSFERSTVTKAFKYSTSKDTNVFDLEYFVELLVKKIGDADITVRRCALESLTAITHAHPNAIRKDAESLQVAAIQMTRIDPSLIKEVDLGPFKHKVDDGIPIRKAAYALIDTMVERVPERVNSPAITEITIKGLEDTAEECMIQCLTLIHRMSCFAPIFVITQIEALIESFNKQFAKNIANVGTNDKAKNIMRSIIRVVEQLHRTPEIEGVVKFSEFFKEKIQDIHASKEIFQNIAATASRQVFSEHF
jgi:cullin-associated NEDD8-dissociated protein 1